MSNQINEKPLIEKAKSGRSSCRTCHNKIIKDSFRIGLPTSFTLPDGNTVISYRYFHPECTSSEYIPSILKILEASSLITNSEKKIIRKSLLNAKQQQIELDSQNSIRNEPYLEYSRSGRGKCRICENSIAKGIFRVAEPSLVELADGRKIFGTKLYHIECFVTTTTKFKIEELIEFSIRKGKITKGDSESLIKEFQKHFFSDKEAEDILALIKEEPIKLDKLKAAAEKKGIDFDIVKNAIEKGLIQGIYFQPTSDTIQRL